MKMTRLWSALGAVLVAGAVVGTPAALADGGDYAPSTTGTENTESATESTDSETSTISASVEETTTDETTSNESSASSTDSSTSSSSSTAESTTETSTTTEESTTEVTTTTETPVCIPEDEISGTVEVNGEAGTAHLVLDPDPLFPDIPLCVPYPMNFAAWSYITPGQHWSQLISEHQDVQVITTPGEYWFFAPEGWCGQLDFYHAGRIAAGTVMTAASVGYEQVWPVDFQYLSPMFWSADVKCSIPETSTSATTTTTDETTLTTTPEESTTVNTPPPSTTDLPTVTPTESIPVNSPSVVVEPTISAVIIPAAATSSWTTFSTLAAVVPLPVQTDEGLAYTGVSETTQLVGQVGTALIGAGVLAVYLSRKRKLAVATGGEHR